MSDPVDEARWNAEHYSRKAKRAMMNRHTNAPSIGIALERAEARVRELEAEVARLRAALEAATAPGPSCSG